jgi:hypothetical protein
MVISRRILKKVTKTGNTEQRRRTRLDWFPDKYTPKDFAHEKHTKAPEGAAIGGTVGLGTGAVLGLLAGIDDLFQASVP